MVFVAISRQAAKKIKAKKYHSKVDDLLSNNSSIKVLGIAEIAVKTNVNVGITGRRGVVNEVKEEVKAAVGRDKRTLIIIQKKGSDETYFLFLYPKTNEDNKTSEDIRENTSTRVDASVATDRGHSILTTSNTVVSRKSSSNDSSCTYVFQPENSRYLKNEAYEVEILRDYSKSGKAVAFLDEWARY